MVDLGAANIRKEGESHKLQLSCLFIYLLTHWSSAPLTYRLGSLCLLINFTRKNRKANNKVWGEEVGSLLYTANDNRYNNYNCKPASG